MADPKDIASLVEEIAIQVEEIEVGTSARGARGGGGPPS